MKHRWHRSISPTPHLRVFALLLSACANAYAQTPVASLDDYCAALLMTRNRIETARIVGRSEPGFYLPGELVQIGQVGRPARLLRADTQSTIEVAPGLFPLPGRFVGSPDAEHRIVEVRSEDGRLFTVIVSRGEISPLPIGTVENLRSILKTLDSIPLEFKVGERVRFRPPRASALMFSGVFEGVKPAASPARAKYLVRAPDGKIKSCELNAVFKASGDIPASTPYFDSELEWLGAGLRPHHAVREFLDAGARLTSHPEFMNAAPEERIRMLSQFVHWIVQWNPVALRIEAHGFMVHQQTGRPCLGGG